VPFTLLGALLVGCAPLLRWSKRQDPQRAFLSGLAGLGVSYLWSGLLCYKRPEAALGDCPCQDFAGRSYGFEAM